MLLSRNSLLHHHAQTLEQLHSTALLRSAFTSVVNNLNLGREHSTNAVVQVTVSINFVKCIYVWTNRVLVAVRLTFAAYSINNLPFQHVRRNKERL